jgi:hypothetical protein
MTWLWRPGGRARLSGVSVRGGCRWAALSVPRTGVGAGRAAADGGALAAALARCAVYTEWTRCGVLAAVSGGPYIGSRREAEGSGRAVGAHQGRTARRLPA